MVVGISIDDVFRNFSENFNITLDKIYGGYLNNEEVFDSNNTSLGYEDIVRYQTDGEDYEFVRSSYDLLEISKKFGITNKRDLYKNLYDEYSFEFFATCDLIDKSYKLPNKFNKLIIDLEEDYKEPIDLIIIDRSVSRAKTSTMFFLSKCGIYPNTVKFVKNYGDEWDYVDLLVTANNETLESKPEGKISVKINTEYNKNIKSDYTYNTLEECIDSFDNMIKIEKYEN